MPPPSKEKDKLFDNEADWPPVREPDGSVVLDPRWDTDPTIQAPHTAAPDRMDVMSGADVNFRKPQFRSQQNVDQHDIEVQKIQQLMDQLDAAQKSDMRHAGMQRHHELGLLAGGAVSSGIAGLPQTVIPEDHRPSAGAQQAQKIKMYDELLNSLSKRENPEKERENKIVIQDKRDATTEDVAGKKIEAQAEEEAKKKTFKHEERKQHEEFVGSEGNKNRAAGLIRPVVAAEAKAGNSQNNSDARFANDQAKMQIPGYDQIKPNSDTDHTSGADIAGSNNVMQDVGSKMIKTMRENGRNFPQSTEWKKLASDYMTINQALNHLNRNGVMNFKDKDNNDVQIGNAQEFFQYVQNNGPEVLQHALDTLNMSSDAQMYARGYKRNKDAKIKTAKDYMGQSSSGGQTKSGPLQNPNTLPAIIDSVNKGTPMPELRDTPMSNGLPERKDSGGVKARWDPQKRHMVDQNGNPI